MYIESGVLGKLFLCECCKPVFFMSLDVKDVGMWCTVVKSVRGRVPADVISMNVAFFIFSPQLELHIWPFVSFSLLAGTSTVRSGDITCYLCGMKYLWVFFTTAPICNCMYSNLFSHDTSGTLLYHFPLWEDVR